MYKAVFVSKEKIIILEDLNFKNKEFEQSILDSLDSRLNKDQKWDVVSKNIACQVIEKYPDAKDIHVDETGKTQQNSEEQNRRMAGTIILGFLAILFAPIILTFAMNGILIKKVFANVRKLPPFKRFRSIFLLCGYSFMLVCLLLIVLFVVLKTGAEAITAILAVWFVGNIVYFILSAVLSNRIWRKYKDVPIEELENNELILKKKMGDIPSKDYSFMKWFLIIAFIIFSISFVFTIFIPNVYEIELYNFITQKYSVLEILKLSNGTSKTFIFPLLLLISGSLAFVFFIVTLCAFFLNPTKHYFVLFSALTICVLLLYEGFKTPRFVVIDDTITQSSRTSLVFTLLSYGVVSACFLLFLTFALGIKDVVKKEHKKTVLIISVIALLICIGSDNVLVHLGKSFSLNNYKYGDIQSKYELKGEQTYKMYLDPNDLSLRGTIKNVHLANNETFYIEFTDEGSPYHGDELIYKLNSDDPAINTRFEMKNQSLLCKTEGYYTISIIDNWIIIQIVE